MCIRFDRGGAVENLVDNLIHASNAKPTHPILLPFVRIIRQDGLGGGGAGFFWNKDGDIVTNAHVVRNDETVFVAPVSRDLVMSKQGYLAEVIAKDDFSDLALLRIKKESPFYQAFLSTYHDFPYVLRDQRSWHRADLSYLNESKFLIYGFPNYALAKPTALSGKLIKDSIELYGIRRLLLDFKADHGCSGGPVFTEEGFLAGITDSMFINPDMGLLGGLVIDYTSAEMILNQLKESKKVTQDLIIYSDGFGSVHVERVARNFDFHMDWSNEEGTLVYEGLTFVNAYAKSSGNKVPIGVLLYENKSTNPSYAQFTSQSTLVRKVNGKPLNGFGLESSLRRLSWILRSVPENEPLQLEIVQNPELPK